MVHAPPPSDTSASPVAPRPSPLTLIRTLTPADIPALMRLKAAAGWNQTRQDWEHLLALAPESCFGLECDGVLAASTTAVCYGRELAWIGMVLTDPAYRGRGFARQLMEYALGYLRAARVAWVKLDATDMGRPLYARLGFTDECAVERWVRPPGRTAGILPARITPGEKKSRHAACATAAGAWRELDRRAFGADRSALLERLRAVESFEVPGAGFAMGRPGSCAAYFGPCVSRSADAAEELLRNFLAVHGAQDVAWDLLPQNKAAVEVARGRGFTLGRSLVRMALRLDAGAKPLECESELIYAIAGLEYG